MSYRHLAQALLRGEPYFGPALRALQGPPDRQRYFLPAVRAAAQRPTIEIAAQSPSIEIAAQSRSMEILEVGSWAGASAVSWASAMKKLNLEGKVTCVDPWVPYFDSQKEQDTHYEHMNQAAAHGMIRKLFDHNVAASGFSGSIVAMPGKSSAILPTLADQSFDLIYLDGSHAFEDVLFDIQQAKRLIRPGGIVCGDDLEIQWKGLDPGEVESSAQSGHDVVLSALGAYYHPGVTLAVAREFGDVSSWDGFWALRLPGGEVVLDDPEPDLPAHLAPHVVRSEGEAPGYYLIATQNRYFGLATHLGPPDVAAEFLQDEDLPPLIFTGTSLDQVRDKIQENLRTRVAETEGESAGVFAIPLVIGSHRGFNLVRLKTDCYGLRQSLGPVDLSIGNAQLSAQYEPGDAVIGDTLETVKARIDAIEAERELEGLKAALNALLHPPGRAEGASS